MTKVVASLDLTAREVDLHARLLADAFEHGGHDRDGFAFAALRALVTQVPTFVPQYVKEMIA